MPDFNEHPLFDPFAVPEAWRDNLQEPAHITGEASLFDHPNFNRTRLHASPADGPLISDHSTQLEATP